LGLRTVERAHIVENGRVLNELDKRFVFEQFVLVTRRTLLVPDGNKSLADLCQMVFVEHVFYQHIAVFVKKIPVVVAQQF
jgi:hypothetical protein